MSDYTSCTMMSDSEFSKMIQAKELEYNQKQEFLKIPAEITFSNTYPDIDFNSLSKLSCRTDDNCSHYYFNQNRYSLNAGTNTWSVYKMTPFYEQFLK